MANEKNAINTMRLLPAGPCVADEEIFSMKCLDDFKIQLIVEQPVCFAHLYPHLDITDLVVFADHTSQKTDNDSCTAFTIGTEGKNHFFSDLDLSGDVTSTSDKIYFDAKVRTDFFIKSSNCSKFV